MNLYITGREGKGRARGRVEGREGKVKVQCKGRGGLRSVDFDGDEEEASKGTQGVRDNKVYIGLGV